MLAFAVLLFTLLSVPLRADDPLSLERMKSEFPEELRILGPEVFTSVFRMLQARAPQPSNHCNGRLTLTSGSPVTTADVTSVATIYFTPYNGNRISLRSGTGWRLITFTEQSAAVPATTATPFDIFGYISGSNLALETVNWSSGTTRATALTLQDNVYVKSGDATRRYLGTARTIQTSGRTTDSVNRRLVWNACNRLPRNLVANGATGSWTYTVNAWRAANGDTTVGVTRMEWVTGLSLEPVEITLGSGTLQTGATAAAPLGIGINSVSANSAKLYGGTAHNALNLDQIVYYQDFPTIGYNYANWLEASTAVGITTWYGDFNDGIQKSVSGMFGITFQ